MLPRRPIQKVIVFVALVLSILIPLGIAPRVALAASVDPTWPDGRPGAYLLGTDVALTAIQGYMSVQTGYVIPNLEVYPLQTERFAWYNQMQPKSGCLGLTTTHFRNDNQPQRDELIVWVRCDSSPPVVPWPYAKITMDATFYSKYVQTYYTPTPHMGWTGQVVKNNDAILAEIVNVGSGCWEAHVYNFLTSAWDNIGPGVPSNYACGTPNNDSQTYVGFRWDNTLVGAANNSFPEDTLGTYRSASITGIITKSAANPSWHTITPEEAYYSGPGNCGNGSCASTTELASGLFRAEWGKFDTGLNFDTGDILMCADTPNNANCNYSLYSTDKDTYGGSTMKINIQRAPTANTVLRGSNVKIAQNRSYFISSMYNYGAPAYSNTMWVDFSGAGSYFTIKDQGYTLRYGSTAPTCSWATATKYQCVSAIGSPVDTVWIKLEAGLFTVSGLNFQGGTTINGTTYNFVNRTYRIEP